MYYFLVIVTELNEKQLEQRHRFGYYQPTTDEEWIKSLSQSWNIQRDVLEFNLKKLLTLIEQLAHKRMYHGFLKNVQQDCLHEDEYKIALEFYLQIDRDLCYIKTMVNESKNIFLTNEQPPYGHYTMDSCHQKSCCLCYPSLRIEPESTIQHIFVNGYRSILNCPATCTSRNIIYVLTCPCKKFDYIGETNLSLPQRLICNLFFLFFFYKLLLILFRSSKTWKSYYKRTSFWKKINKLYQSWYNKIF